MSFATLTAIATPTLVFVEPSEFVLLSSDGSTGEPSATAVEVLVAELRTVCAPVVVVTVDGLVPPRSMKALVVPTIVLEARAPATLIVPLLVSALPPVVASGESSVVVESPSSFPLAPPWLAIADVMVELTDVAMIVRLPAFTVVSEPWSDARVVADGKRTTATPAPDWAKCASLAALAYRVFVAVI